MASIPPTIVPCARECLETAIVGIGCDVADTACVCTPEKFATLSIDRNLVNCVINSCSGSDLSGKSLSRANRQPGHVEREANSNLILV